MTAELPAAHWLAAPETTAVVKALEAEGVAVAPNARSLAVCGRPATRFILVT